MIRHQGRGQGPRRGYSVVWNGFIALTEEGKARARARIDRASSNLGIELHTEVPEPVFSARCVALAGTTVTTGGRRIPAALLMYGRDNAAGAYILTDGVLGHVSLAKTGRDLIDLVETEDNSEEARLPEYLRDFATPTLGRAMCGVLIFSSEQSLFQPRDELSSHAALLTRADSFTERGAVTRNYKLCHVAAFCAI